MIRGEKSKKGMSGTQKRAKLVPVLLFLALTFSVFTSCGEIVFQNPFIMPYNFSDLDFSVVDKDASAEFVNLRKGLNNEMVYTAGAFTISLWYKRFDSVDASYRPLLSNLSSSGGMALQEGGLSYKHENGSGAFGFSDGTFNGEGIWNHHVLIITDSDYSFYVNGVVHTGEYMEVGSSHRPLYIGASVLHENMEHDSLNQITTGFLGQICNVRVWKGELDTSQVSDVYSGTYNFSSDENLIGSWNLDEGSGQIVTNLVSGGSDGTLGPTESVDEQDPEWVETTGPYGSTRYVLSFEPIEDPFMGIDDEQSFDVAVSSSIEMAIPVEYFGGLGYKHFEPIFYQSDSGELDFTGSLEDDLSALPSASITIDGSFSDWGGISPFYSDPSGDENVSVAGADLTDFVMAQDGSYLYVRFDLSDNSPNPDNLYILHMADNAGFGYGSPGFKVYHDGSTWIGITVGQE